MSEKTFLVKMDTKNCCRSFIELPISDVCWLENNEGCDGDLNNRPAWCPLVEYVDVIKVLGETIRSADAYKKSL